MYICCAWRVHARTSVIATQWRLTQQFTSARRMPRGTQTHNIPPWHTMPRGAGLLAEHFITGFTKMLPQMGFDIHAM